MCSSTSSELLSIISCLSAWGLPDEQLAGLGSLRWRPRLDVGLVAAQWVE